MPVAATKHTADGAKAFAEFFIKTIDWGYATTSSAYMRHYYLTCGGCSSFARTIDRDARAGYRYIGGRLTVTAVDLIAVPRNARVLVSVSGTARAVLNHRGHVVHAYSAIPKLRFGITSAWINGQWRVVDLGVVV